MTHCADCRFWERTRTGGTCARLVAPDAPIEIVTTLVDPRLAPLVQGVVHLHTRFDFGCTEGLPPETATGPRGLA